MNQFTHEVEDLLNQVVDRVTQADSTRHERDNDSDTNSENSDTTEDSRIKLIRMPSGIYVFNQKDIQRLRTTERVLGSFCGPAQTMPTHSKLAPPLTLRSEETRLLLSNGRARLLSVSTKEKIPASEKMKALENFQRKLLEYSNRDRYREKLESLCLVGTKKKNELLHPDNVPYNPTPYDKNNPYIVQLVDTPFKIFENETQLCQADDPISEMKFQVFSYLWQMGNFVTGGSNFSADYLVYKGDPSQYHAFACVHCLPPDGTLSALDVIRNCRIGSSVRKNIVIATVFDGRVSCVTLNWEA